MAWQEERHRDEASLELKAGSWPSLQPCSGVSSHQRPPRVLLAAVSAEPELLEEQSLYQLPPTC